MDNNKINLTDMNGASLGINRVFVRDANEFASVASNFSDIWLVNDIDVGSMIWPDMPYGKTIELNGYSLSYSQSLTVGAHGLVTFHNGTLNFTNDFGYGLRLSSGADLCLDNVQYNSNDCGIVVIDDGQSRSEVEIVNGSVINAKEHGILTSQIGDNGGNVTSNVRIHVADSTISTKDSNNGDNSAIVFNVKGSVNIENSTIIADRQAVVLRSGEGHVVRNSTLRVTGNNEVSKEYLDEYWGGGNEVPLAALVIGNRSKEGYRYPTSVTLENAKLSVPMKNNAEKDYFAMYVYQSERMTLNTVKAEGTVRYVGEGSKVNSNMNGATFNIEELM